jgi:hypothetical protein
LHQQDIVAGKCWHSPRPKFIPFVSPNSLVQ